jgi:transposase
MKNSILHIGLDVDDKNFHGAIFNTLTGEMSSFKCKPNIAGLMKQFKRLTKKGYELKVCYEASFIGFGLCRELQKKGINCEVIAPSLIPFKPGDKVKTDKRDAEKLAEYYAKEMLTTIYIPDEKDEAVRSLVRSRSFMVEERKRLKQHILSLCKIHNLNYKESTEKINYWTKTHISWLEAQLSKLDESLRKTFKLLLSNYVNMSMIIMQFDKKIEEASESKRYVNNVKALNCFRGLSTLSSMSLILEIGDIRRFSHPKYLTSYSGFDLIEYSSGGKEKKYCITKMGNKRIRTTVVESSQFSFREPKISRRLSKARDGIEPKIINIADKCMYRLKDKYKMMLRAGKARNKIKVACAREMLCFIWEALMMLS